MKPALAAAAVAIVVLLSARVRTNQPAPAPGPVAAADHGRHLVTLPDQLQWQDGKALPPGAKVAILEGDPTQEGYFAMRVKLPDGYRIPPHSHPCHERVTVLSGTFHLGTGEKFDKSSARALPAGTYTSMEPGMRHFAWTAGETQLQITTIGPWGITYVNPADDPRSEKPAPAEAR